MRRAVDTSWPVLTQLGLTEHGDPGGVHFLADPRAAVDGAGFVQESVPERLGLKHDLYAAIEPALGAETVVASSASGLTLTEMQGGWRDPECFVRSHPFNPPHLVPLVEVMGNAGTAPGVVGRARAFYESVGKVTIEVRREVPGHVANRLQAALWREAIHLVNEGVASVEDVDTAVSAGPGLRWAAMGPTLLFHLGAGEGGLAAFCERYADSFNRWFDDLGRPHLDEATSRRLVEGLRPISESHSIDDLSDRRDALLTELIACTRSPGLAGHAIGPHRTRRPSTRPYTTVTSTTARSATAGDTVRAPGRPRHGTAASASKKRQGERHGGRTREERRQAGAHPRRRHRSPLAARHIGRQLRAVARQAGVALGLVHYYYDKATLIGAALRRIGGQDVAMVEPDPSKSPKDNLRAALRRVADAEYLTTEYLSLRLQLWALAQAHPDFAEINTAAQERYRKALAGLSSSARPDLPKAETSRRATDFDSSRTASGSPRFSGSTAPRSGGTSSDARRSPSGDRSAHRAARTGIGTPATGRPSIRTL